MGIRQGRRRDLPEWRALMKRFGEAGARVDEFCAREGLSPSSFYRWRDRVGASGSAGASTPVRKRPPALAVQPVAAGFIDLGQLPARSRDGGTALELRLDLGCGIVLQIVRR
jgi:transposase-like protein